MRLDCFDRNLFRTKHIHQLSLHISNRTDRVALHKLRLRFHNFGILNRGEQILFHLLERCPQRWHIRLTDLLAFQPSSLDDFDMADRHSVTRRLEPRQIICRHDRVDLTDLRHLWCSWSVISLRHFLSRVQTRQVLRERFTQRERLRTLRQHTVRHLRPQPHRLPILACLHILLDTCRGSEVAYLSVHDLANRHRRRQRLAVFFDPGFV